MSTIYAFTTPARGHLYPITPILAELVSRGHRVKVWTLASEVEGVRAQGIEAAAMRPEVEALPVDDWEADRDLDAIKRTLRTWLERAPHEVAEVEQALEAERPDLIVADINAWGTAAAAEASGVAWASFSPYLSFLPGRGVPVFGPGLKPLRGPLGRIRDAAMKKLVIGTFDRTVLAGLNEVRSAAGATPLGTLTEIWTRPPVLLYMTVREFEHPRPDWPSSFVFTGPTIWEPPAETPEWLSEIQRPLVLVTASTEYQKDAELISTALGALAGEDVEVIATTAGNDPALFSPPENARVERFVPHGPVLERAHAVICHGGMGITQKALAHGLPVCVVGWGRDQLETGRRVERAAAGSFLPRKRLSADALRDAYREAVTRRAGAERIARAMAAAPGAGGAADSLEMLIGRRSPASAPV